MIPDDKRSVSVPFGSLFLKVTGAVAGITASHKSGIFFCRDGLKWFALHSTLFHYAFLVQSTQVKKGKSVLLQAWSGREGSSKLRFPDFMTMAQDGGKVVSLTPRKCSWYSFPFFF